MTVPPPDTEHSTPEESLSSALAAIARRPLPLLFESWNWKSASVSAIVRGCIFLTANLRAGGHKLCGR
jgi:hypothetical protein